MWKLWRRESPANEEVVDYPQDVGDIRTTARRKIYREAFLHLPEGVRIKCVALDISPLGTRVRLTRACFLPDEIFVTVLDEVQKMRARIAWREGHDVGLQFSDPDLDADAYLATLPVSEFEDEGL